MSRPVAVIRAVFAVLAVLAACVTWSAMAATQVDPAAVAGIVARQTSAFRADNGLGPLKVDPGLGEAAQRFAEYMASTDQYGHEADGRKPTDRARQHGYDYCMVAENVGYQASSSGFASDELAQRLMEGWEQSPGHRHNMLLPQIVDIGVGVALSNRTGRYYAVQMFGRPKSAASRFVLANGAGAPVRYELDTRSYELPPGVVRTHEGCFTGTLKVLGAPSAANGIAPRDGARYTVMRDSGGTLRVETSAPASPR